MLRRSEQAKLLCHEILYRAIIEMRASCTAGDTDRIFRLANLTHNMPPALSRARAKRDYERILDEMRARADDHGYAWLSRHFPDDFPSDRSDV